MVDAEYTVRVSERARRSRLQLRASGELVVVVPRGFDHSRIPPLVRDHEAWILRARQRLRQRLGEAPAPRPIVLPDRVDLLAVDQAWEVTYQETPDEWVRAEEQAGHKLRIWGAVSHQPNVLVILRDWLSFRTKASIVPQLRSLAEEHGFAVSRTNVRSQRTRWGSCSTRGSINLNIRLLLMPADLVRYVLVHELAHTRQMNHSDKFWDLVGSIEPDYQDKRRRLRAAGRALPAWIEFG